MNILWIDGNLKPQNMSFKALLMGLAFRNVGIANMLMVFMYAIINLDRYELKRIPGNFY